MKRQLVSLQRVKSGSPPVGLKFVLILGICVAQVRVSKLGLFNTLPIAYKYQSLPFSLQRWEIGVIMTFIL